MTKGTTKVTPDKVLEFVKAGGQRTIQEVATHFDVGPQTARKYVTGLLGTGALKKAGNRPQPGTGLGRPSNLYTA